MKAVLLAAVSGLVVLAASAQQPPAGDQPPKDMPREVGAQPEPSDRAGLKARAERRLAEAKRQQERWEAAIKKLDAGAPLDEVEADMRGPRPFPGTRGPDRSDGNRGPRSSGQSSGGARTDSGPDRGPPPAPQGSKLSREEVLDFLAKEFPEISKRFGDAMKENSERTSHILDRMEPRIRELLAEHDPEMRALRNQNFAMDFVLLNASKTFIEAAKKNAPADEIKKASDVLRQAWGEHFDLQIKIHQQEVVMLDRRIKQIKKDLEEQLPKRDEFIQKRLEGLQRMSKDRDREHGGGTGGSGAGGQAPKR